MKKLCVLILSLLILMSCTEPLPKVEYLGEPFFYTMTVEDLTPSSAVAKALLSAKPGLIGLSKTRCVVVPLHGSRDPMHFKGQFPDDSWEVPAQIIETVPDEQAQDILENYGLSPDSYICIRADLNNLEPGEIYQVWIVADYGQDPVVMDYVMEAPLFSPVQVTSVTWNGATFQADVNTSSRLGRWFFAVTALEKGEVTQEDLSEYIWITRYSLLNPYETSPQNISAKLSDGKITAVIQNLNPGVRYRVHAYRESNGVSNYSQGIEFQTEKVERPEVPQVTDLTSSTAAIRFQIPLEATGAPGIELKKDDGEEYTELNAPAPQWDEDTGFYTIQLNKLSSSFCYHIRTYYLKDGQRIHSDRLNFRPLDK